MTKQETVNEWYDSIGQKIHPGDYIAVATINGRSPQLVYAQIKQINKTNKDGKPYYFGFHGPAQALDPQYYNLDNYTPTVVVSAVPIYSGRDFYRSDNPRAVSYSIVGNITKLSDEQVEAVKNQIEEI